MKHETFGADWVMYVGGMRSSCFMAKCGNSQHRHGHQEERRQKLLITFHLQGLKVVLSEFEVGAMKSVGGVR